MNTNEAPRAHTQPHIGTWAALMGRRRENGSLDWKGSGLSGSCYFAMGRAVQRARYYEVARKMDKKKKMDIALE